MGSNSTMSAFGEKRTSGRYAAMSANDPLRTSVSLPAATLLTIERRLQADRTGQRRDTNGRQNKRGDHVRVRETLKRHRKGGFFCDEVDIPHDADEDRIKEVLDVIGRQDEYEILLEKAEREIPQPDSPKYVSRQPDVPADLDIVKEEFKKIEQMKKGKRRSNKATLTEFVKAA